MVLLLAGALLLGCAVPASEPSPADRQPTAPATAAALAPIRDALYAEIAKTRSAHDLPALARRPLVESVAQAHSQDMAQQGYFAHVSPQGATPSDRAQAAGLDCTVLAGQPAGLSENLFQTTAYRRFTYPQDDPAARTYEWQTPDELARAAVDGWLDSPGHRANLLRATSSLHGIGLAYDSEHRLYVTHVLC
jgi:uncharacterized protein YkwD